MLANLLVGGLHFSFSLKRIGFSLLVVYSELVHGNDLCSCCFLL